MTARRRTGSSPPVASGPVLVLPNWRTPGLAGARNTGILAAGDCELVRSL